MARIRTVKPEFFKHKPLARCSPHARLLAIALMQQADCEGRLEWIDLTIHGEVFPWETSVNVRALLGELVGIGFAVHYESGEREYVALPTFRKHQRLTGKEAGMSSKLPDYADVPGESLVKHPDAQGTGEQGNRGTEKTSTSAREAEPEQDDWNALDLYRRLGGRGMAIPSTGKVKGKPVMLSALMVAICNQNDGATIDDLVAESATKGNGLDWFLACFDSDTGKRKPKPQGRRRNSGPVPAPAIDNAPTIRQWIDNDSRRDEWLYSVARLHGDSPDDDVWNYTIKRGAEFSPPDALRDEAIAYVRAVAERLL
ncbi:MAG: hypothetical protein ACYS26_18450 [Planctomycetota bacterium]|jgi:hypothetical protein